MKYLIIFFFLFLLLSKSGLKCFRVCNVSELLCKRKEHVTVTKQLHFSRELQSRTEKQSCEGVVNIAVYSLLIKKVLL